MTDIKRVWGPCVARLLIHPEDKQTVLLFGEFHQPYEEKCDALPQAQEISAYIKDLAKGMNKRLLDLFLEESYQIRVAKETKPIEGTSGGFASILNTFRECLELEKRYDCPLNVRLHYIDIRWTSQELLIDRLDTLHTGYMEGKKDLASILPTFKILLPRLSLEDDQRFFQEQVDLINRELKEYNRFFGTRIFEELKKLVEDIKYDATPFRNLLDRAKEFIERPESPSPQLDQAIFDYTKARAFPLDLFTLARMFHRYTKAPHEAKSIVFYGGARHSSNIRAFLLKCGYLDLVDPSWQFDINKCRQCVKLPPFHLIKYYMNEHPRTIIVNDPKRGKSSRGITTNVQDLYLSKSITPGTTIWSGKASFLWPLKHLFPGHEIFFLRPDVVYLGDYRLIEIEKINKKMGRRIRFVQAIDPNDEEIPWYVRLGFIDESVPILPQDILLVPDIIRLFPGRRMI
jgi:hypothetical protein